eukprot:1889147-Prymnesium_polylepis.1
MHKRDLRSRRKFQSGGVCDDVTCGASTDQRVLAGVALDHPICLGLNWLALRPPLGSAARAS